MLEQIILGIDPGTRITGYALLSGIFPSLEVLDFGAIRPPPKAPLQNRYLILFESLESIVQKYKPHAISVESQFVKKNVQSAMKLGMAKGMVLLLAAKYTIPLFEYAPKKAKAAIIGNGNASKYQVQKSIQMRLKLSQLPTPEDAADALALAVCHAQIHTRKRHV